LLHSDWVGIHRHTRMGDKRFYTTSGNTDLTLAGAYA
jgi:hypothetical protein